MINLSKILAGKTTKITVHGPQKNDKIIINLEQAPIIERKAMPYMWHILYDKKGEYKLNTKEEEAFYNDLVEAGVANNEEISFDQLSEYRAFIFNNRHKLAA